MLLPRSLFFCIIAIFGTSPVVQADEALTPPPTNPPVMTNPDTVLPITAQPTLMGQQEVDVIIQNITIIYRNVGRLQQADFRDLESLTETWFDAFYNNEEIRQLQHGRDLQGDAKGDLVQNMESSMLVQWQDPDDDTGKNTITFDQQLKYVALPGASEPEFYVVAPYRDTIANGQLGRLLKSNIMAFQELEFPIEAPKLPISPATPTSPPTLPPPTLPPPADTTLPTDGPVPPPTPLPSGGATTTFLPKATVAVMAAMAMMGGIEL